MSALAVTDKGCGDEADVSELAAKVLRHRDGTMVFKFEVNRLSLINKGVTLILNAE